MRSLFLALLLALSAQAQFIPFPWYGGGAVQPPSGMVLWLSADCITYSGGICSTPADGTSLSAWNDRSGTANNATKATGTCTFHTGQINSQPAVTFSSCGWSITTGIGNGPFGCGGSSLNQCYLYVFAVFKNAATAYKGDLTACSGANQGCFKYWTGTARQQGADESDAAAIASGTAAQDTSWHQSNVQTQSFVSGASTQWNVTFRLDRGSDGSSSPVTTSGLTNLLATIGYDPRSGSEFLNGQLAEELIYNTQLTATQISQVETYLHNKYGL